MPENRDKTKYSVFLIISHSYHNLAQVGVAASPLRSGLSGEERRLRGKTRGVHAPSCSAFLVRPVTPGRCPQGLHRRR